MDLALIELFPYQGIPETIMKMVPFIEMYENCSDTMRAELDRKYKEVLSSGSTLLNNEFHSFPNEEGGLW